MSVQTKKTSSTEKAAPQNKKRQQALAAKAHICDATIWCLDTYGYSETSINRIIERAEVSRGALTHHFPAKEDLIVETLNRLLERPIRAKSPAFKQAEQDSGMQPEKLFYDDMIWLWKSIIFTREGRAYSEILAAARTDEVLKKRITKPLREWGVRLTDFYARRYVATSGKKADAMRISIIFRAFFRGLLIQEPTFQNEEEMKKTVDLFIKIISPHISPRV